MKKAILALLLTVSVVGCTLIHKNVVKKPDLSQEITTKHCDLSPFKSIVLKGNATVTLVNGSPAIDITGIRAQTDKYNCQTSVVDQILYVNVGDDKAPGAIVKLKVPELKNIMVADNVALEACNFKTGKFVITTSGYATINFSGKYDISRIFQLGRGKIKIDWIDSDSLLISGSDSGTIILAGTVNNLTVKLIKNSKLNARYLRAEKSSVVATDTAQAKIKALTTLDAFAVNKSSVYYYGKRPANLTIVTRDFANVLRLN